MTTTTMTLVVLSTIAPTAAFIGHGYMMDYTDLLSL
jgi:hypothetical protein